MKCKLVQDTTSDHTTEMAGISMNRKFSAAHLTVASILVIVCVTVGLANTGAQAREVDDTTSAPVEEEGIVHVSSFDLPESSFLSKETREALKRWRYVYLPSWAKALQSCPPIDAVTGAGKENVSDIRKCQINNYYQTPMYRRVRETYAVALAPMEIGGVYTEVFTPEAGVAQKNQRRVLINLHGGGFKGGARWESHLESIPIASVGRIKVISIDYRQAPEAVFPAASQDVASVYRELLKTYSPQNIGIYGCSAGGWLTAQSMAWFQKEGLPLPGAIGMFGGAAQRALNATTSKWVRSDATRFADAISGVSNEKTVEPNRYYLGRDRRNPLASPGDYDETMAKFPPSLLLSGVRDSLMSEVLVTHSQLVRLGVKADLHVWEGMGHCFQVNPDFPESKEAYQVIVKFFDAHLGTREVSTNYGGGSPHAAGGLRDLNSGRAPDRAATTDR